MSSAATEPEQAGDRVGGGEQRAGAVLAVEAQLEGVLAGGQRRRARGRPGCASSRALASRSSRSSRAADGGLVLGVEALLAGVEPGDPGLEGGEVALRALGAGQGLLAGLAQPADLVVGGRGAGLRAR